MKKLILSFILTILPYSSFSHDIQGTCYIQAELTRKGAYNVHEITLYLYNFNKMQERELASKWVWDQNDKPAIIKTYKELAKSLQDEGVCSFQE